MASTPIREGFQTLVPYLSVRGAAGLIDFLRVVLGASETFRASSGTHYEVRIGDSMLMIGEVGDRTPATAQLFLYVEDADAVYARAIHAGARSVIEPSDRPWGEGEDMIRGAGVTDPTGNTWYFAGGVRRS